MENPLHILTPTIESVPLSNSSGLRIYLKLENTQPTSTFKIRGIGLLCQKAKSNGATHLIASSGGNAGLAAAYAGRHLAMETLICVPESTTEKVKSRIRQEGAIVETHGAIWNESNDYALQLVKQPGYFYVHPFDHPDIWEGHSSMMEECRDQMSARPDLIVCCCGGGGLFNGIVIGMQKIGWAEVPILVMETVGADCFNQSIKAGKIIRTSGITSIAKTLGSTIVCEKTWELAQKHKVFSKVVTDKQALNACLKFADDHRYLVEPSCGASLAAVYSDVINNMLAAGELSNVKTVLVIVCGGNASSLEQLMEWKSQLNE